MRRRRGRPAGPARVITAWRWWRLPRSAGVVAPGWWWLVMMGRGRRLMTFRRWWRGRRIGGDVAGAAGSRRIAVDDVVRIERAAHTRGGAAPAAGAFDIGRPRGWARRVGGVVDAVVPDARRRGRTVVTNRDGNPLRELAPRVGRTRRGAGRVSGIVGAHVRRDWTTQRYGLKWRRGTVEAVGPECEADNYGSCARDPRHDAHRICGLLQIIGGLDREDHALDFG
jgi:hypothetical protein